MGEVSDFFADIDFAEFIEALYDGGWFQIVFPFMLVYAVVFTILNQVDIFEKRKPVKVIVALVFAFFAVSFPIAEGPLNCGFSGDGAGGDTLYGGITLGDFMTCLFPGVTAFTMGVLALYIVAAMLGVDLVRFFGDNKKDQFIKYILGALGIFVVVYYYARGFGWAGFDASDNWFWGNDGILFDPFLYILLLFIGFFVWVTKDDKDEEDVERMATRARNAARDAEDAARHGGH